MAMRMFIIVLHDDGQGRSGLDSTENSYDDLLDHLRIMVRKRRITDFASQESVNRRRARPSTPEPFLFYGAVS